MTSDMRPGITGSITRVAGSMISASGMSGVAMGEVVRVGNPALLGEVIRIKGDTVDAQVFEETNGIYLGEPVVATGQPLSVELGPGLLGETFDGVQRPLTVLQQASGDFISRGLTAPALDRSRRWYFQPRRIKGDVVSGGDILGVVREKHIEHRILVPPGVAGTLQEIVSEGEYRVDETIATLEDNTHLTLMHIWPIKIPRPVTRKLPVDRPFLTGQRVLDCLFPIAVGGTAIVPGGFGTGKTVVEQTLAKFCNADIIVYVGCGERGNEMADVLDEFPHLKDPRTGGPLMDRTILVVNTSNMPVAARDASVYTGVTIAEYYRDQGYDVALMADSTSRWAEALREIASRLEEMPGEEGYPTYLAARIAAFYERSGCVECLSGPNGNVDKRRGSLTIVGAVSPPGGDYSEPVTQTSLRVTGALWALDATLAYRRHYPAINWNRSYTLYLKELEKWFSQHAPTGWLSRYQRLVALLQRDAELQEVVQLVGPDALQDAERLVLESARQVREIFLQQNAFSEVDAYCSLEKSAGLLDALLGFYETCQRAIEQGVSLSDLLQIPAREEMARLRDMPESTFHARQQTVMQELQEQVATLLSAQKENG